MVLFTLFAVLVTFFGIFVIGCMIKGIQEAREARRSERFSFYHYPHSNPSKGRK
jgi:hypothetical protein